MDLKKFNSMLIPLALLSVSIVVSASLPLDLPDENDENANNIMPYLSLAKTIIGSLSYDDFCVLIKQLRESGDINSVLQELKIFNIDHKQFWDFIDQYLGCHGTAQEKNNFRTLVERVSRLSQNTNEGVKKIIDGFRNWHKEL